MTATKSKRIQVFQGNVDALVLLTGHKDGKLVLWNSLMPIKVLKEYKSEIVEIVLTKDTIVVGTEDGNLYFWLYTLDRCIKSIDIKSLPYQLLSTSLKNIVMAGSSIYVNTYGGDFLRIKLRVTEDSPGDFKLKFKEKKIKNLVLFDDTWRTMAVLEKVRPVSRRTTRSCCSSAETTQLCTGTLLTRTS